MMSRMAPRVARTSFVSGCGGNWKCMPRSVPLRALKATFACAMTGLSPCSWNSCWQKVRAKNPRSSLRFSRSRMKAPFSFVSVKIKRCPFPLRCDDGSRRHRLGEPAQVRSQVAASHQPLDLVDAAVARPLEVVEPQADGLVRLVELPRALARVPLRLEAGEDPSDLGEVGAVVALVRAGVLGELDLAAGHGLLHDLRDLADAVVLVVAPHVEGLRVDRLARRGEDGQEGAADVLDVDDGPPGAAVRLEEHLAGGKGP